MRNIVGVKENDFHTSIQAHLALSLFFTVSFLPSTILRAFLVWQLLFWNLSSWLNSTFLFSCVVYVFSFSMCSFLFSLVYASFLFFFYGVCFFLLHHLLLFGGLGGGPDVFQWFGLQCWGLGPYLTSTLDFVELSFRISDTCLFICWMTCFSDMVCRTTCVFSYFQGYLICPQ